MTKIEGTLPWILLYALMDGCQVMLHLGRFTKADIIYEGVILAVSALGTALWRRYRILGAFCLSLGFARVLLFALAWFYSPLFHRWAVHAGFPVSHVNLTPEAVLLIPFGTGLLIFWTFDFLMSLLGLCPFDSEEFFKQAERLAKKENPRFILGKYKRRLIAIDSAARARHLQVVGPTGSGKTQLILGLAYQDMLRGMPVFFMEAKGDRADYETFLELAEKAGRSKDVVYFNPADPESMTYNPVARIGGLDEPNVMADQIARAIGREPGGATDGSHHRNVDFSRFMDLVDILLTTDGEYTLRKIHAYFATEEGRNDVFGRCKDKSLIAPAQAFLEQRSTDLAGVVSTLRPWISGNLGRLVNPATPDITIDSIFEERKLAYFAIPVGYIPLQTNSLGRMVISNLQTYAQARQMRRERSPASIYLDEFSEFATPAFSSFISTVRSAGIWACLSHQDLGQLKRIEGMDKTAFEANVTGNTVGAKVFFRIISPEDAERIAAMLGTHTKKVRTHQIKRGMFLEAKTGMASEAEKEVFNIHPNILKSLRPFRAAIHLGDRNPLIVATPRLYGIRRDRGMK